MTATEFERYRDVLRRGHLATVRRDLVEAAEAYREAADLQPSRAAPHVGLGRVLLIAGRPADALRAFELALARAPEDEAGLAGRADALVGLGRRAEAADTLDGLATLHRAAGRIREAATTLTRSLALAEARWRRRALEGLTETQAGQTEAAVPAAEPAGTGPTPAAGRVAPSTADADGPVAALAALADRAADSADIRALLGAAVGLAQLDRSGAALDAATEALRLAPADPLVYRTIAWLQRGRGWRADAALAVKLVGRWETLIDDPAALDREAGEAEARRDAPGILAVAERHARQGRVDSSADGALEGLALAPGDVGVHLAIARIRLAAGSRDAALEQLDLLAKLVRLTGTPDEREQLSAFLEAQFDPRHDPPPVAALAI